MNRNFLAVLAVTAAMLAALPASGQPPIQTGGTPGTPDATTTIPGNQLPPPPPVFGGVIKEDATNSTPYRPATVVPPNVLLIMTDDQGYGVSGTFGGVIPTPAMERITKAGLRYTQFHSTSADEQKRMEDQLAQRTD